MISHDYIATNQQTFVFPAKLKAFEYKVPVPLAAENIYPAHNGKGEEMCAGLVPDLVAISKIITHMRKRLLAGSYEIKLPKATE